MLATMNARTRLSTEEIRSQILTAASERFRQFGYTKTTMAEIARDCAMSAANLYRYFENKQAIAAILTQQCLDELLLRLKAVVAQEERPAAERLRELVLTVLHYTHGEWSENPRMNELVSEICELRHDIVETFHERKRALLRDLLRQGLERGEFAPHDLDATASALITATTLFRLPLLMHLYPLEDFERRAEELVTLVLNGILKPRCLPPGP